MSKAQGAASPDKLQTVQMFPPVDAVISCCARRRGHEFNVLVVANRHYLDARCLRQFSDAELLVWIHGLDPIGAIDLTLEERG